MQWRPISELKVTQEQFNQGIWTEIWVLGRYKEKLGGDKYWYTREMDHAHDCRGETHFCLIVLPDPPAKERENERR